MAQTTKVLHFDFGAQNLGKTKAPVTEVKGLLKIVAVATAVSFYSSRAFKGITAT
jgi:predicted RNase H-related nuclease YkuK (DUF458 family)